MPLTAVAMVSLSRQSVVSSPWRVPRCLSSPRLLLLELAPVGNAAVTACTQPFEIGKEPVQQLFCPIKEHCLQQAYTIQGLQTAPSREAIVQDPPIDLGREASRKIGNTIPMSTRRHEAVLQTLLPCSQVSAMYLNSRWQSAWTAHPPNKGLVPVVLQQPKHFLTVGSLLG